MLRTLCLIFLALAPATPTTAPVVEKPPIVTRAQWDSKPLPIPDSRKHTPKFITIHHAGVAWKPGADPAAVVRAIQQYGQKEKHWPDLPYHFMIAPDGRIFEARPMEYEPESNTKYDLEGHIGIELMGNFEVERPSKPQIESCVKLAAWLCQDLKIDPSQIAGHKDRAKDQTVCPGNDFYRYLKSGQFVEWVKQTLAGKTPQIDPGPPLEGGPTIVIDTPHPATAPTSGTSDMNFTILEVFYIKPPVDRVIVVGTIDEGTVRVGDKLVVHTATGPIDVEVDNIESIQQGDLKQAAKGQQVGLRLKGIRKDHPSKGDHVTAAG